MDQRVKLYYLGQSPDVETQRPYLISKGLLKSIPECNWRYVAGPEQVIQDARGREHDFSLLEQGFAFRKWSPSTIDWNDEKQIKQTFLKEAEQFVLTEMNLGDSLKHCEVFDWRVSVVPHFMT